MSVRRPAPSERDGPAGTSAGDDGGTGPTELTVGDEAACTTACTPGGDREGVRAAEPAAGGLGRACCCC